MTMNLINNKLLAIPRTRHWILPLIYLAAAGSIIAFVSFYEFPFDSLLWSEFQNTGHIFVFGFLSVLILIMLNSLRAYNRGVWPYNYVFALIITFSLGVITELLQIPGARDADPMDIARDLVGIIVFLTIYMAFDKNLPPRAAFFIPRKRLFVAGAITLLLVSIAPSFLKSYSFIIKSREFPTICDFDSVWDRYFIKTHNLNFERAKLPEAAEGSAALISPRHSGYASLEINEVNNDWTGFDSLSFVIYSPEDDNITLYLRINDKEHDNTLTDRFNRKLLVAKGLNQFKIALIDVENAPRDRKMNMKHIESIIIFFSDYKQSCRLYVDDFRLLKIRDSNFALVE